MSTIVDYLDRQVDLLVLHGGVGTPGDVRLTQALVPEGGHGTVTAGVQKLAQRVIRALCKRRDSAPYLVDDGCNFMLDALSGAWRTTADVAASFHDAKLDVRRQLVADETDDDPDDERYGDLLLRGVGLTDGQVTLRLELRTRAQTSLTFLTPLPILPS